MAVDRNPNSVEGVHVTVRQGDKTGDDPTLADVAERIDAGFAQVDERFKQVDKRFDAVDERFKQVDAKFEKVDQRFDNLRLEIKGDIKELDAKFDQKFDKLDSKFNWLVGLIVLVSLSTASLAVAVASLVRVGVIAG
jgi:predicted nuclease with TOPRIM domain